MILDTLLMLSFCHFVEDKSHILLADIRCLIIQHRRSNQLPCSILTHFSRSAKSRRASSTSFEAQHSIRRRRIADYSMRLVESVSQIYDRTHLRHTAVHAVILWILSNSLRARRLHHSAASVFFWLIFFIYFFSFFLFSLLFQCSITWYQPYVSVADMSCICMVRICRSRP